MNMNSIRGRDVRGLGLGQISKKETDYELKSQDLGWQPRSLMRNTTGQG